jgi:hypothetical protein
MELILAVLGAVPIGYVTPVVVGSTLRERRAAKRRMVSETA